MLVKTKVLIAEENQDFLDKMCSLLAECGFEMVSAPKDGLQLVDRIQTERPGIVLMDVFLPGLDALGVMKRINQLMEGDTPKFMLMSTFESSTLERELIAAGALYYFLKPFSPETAVERIVQLTGGVSRRSVLTRQTSISPSLRSCIRSVFLPISRDTTICVLPSKWWWRIRVSCPLLPSGCIPMLPRKTAPRLPGWNGRSAMPSKWPGTGAMWKFWNSILAIPSIPHAASLPTVNSLP